MSSTRESSPAPSLSPSSESSSSKYIPDGHLDPQINLSNLSEKDKWQLKVRYCTMVNPHARLTTAAGLQLPFDLRFLQYPKKKSVQSVKEWKNDGMVSVATTSCDYCVKINSARPSGSSDAPFSCLVRSRPSEDDIRPDGSQACACCSGLGRIGCRAWGGTHPREGPGSRQTSEVDHGRITLKRTKDDCLDDSSELTSLSEDTKEPQTDSTSTDSDAPLAQRRSKRRKSRHNGSDEVDLSSNKSSSQASNYSSPASSPTSMPAGSSQPSAPLHNHESRQDVVADTVRFAMSVLSTQR